MLHIQNLSLNFGDQALFESLHLSLFQKEWVSLFASSDVGKPTLLCLIAGIDFQGSVQGQINIEANIFILAYNKLILVVNKDQLDPAKYLDF
ncbi:hypothetical protein [Rodentibacter pneumotropicus]|uniref:Uncharacterized protein n=1 Tax=Rodentibacter pneumotropicus TaxID=758 RepID=A0A4S2P5S1_9PAST|nr:hypothetical protein [Rodentibacter pneumotropicus]TGZ98281.1 hypothetical protein D3M79_09915 [Rodentibacter pneumotropicus]THA01745.1 hypothetical protein D3M74_05175 [Rodentibacter pneumotropicus]THA08529.1 hypothetical protein D3M77_04505 [Rodentibacter pneumotropicus]THA15694.1 hypothetical protein D3M76_04570 [Rodentibacter pneumotropicus]